MKTKEQKLLFGFSIGRLRIGVFNYNLGFEYKDFGCEGKRKDFGFIKFWLHNR
jgi:hypothetical protein